MIDVRVRDDGWADVTFRLPGDLADHDVHVVGAFNDWDHTATPMTLQGDELVASVVVRFGRRYRFRYLLDGEHWQNDWQAHDYEPNEFGGDDSVLDVTRVGDSVGDVTPQAGDSSSP